jgi:hypothetical protein
LLPEIAIRVMKLAIAIRVMKLAIAIRVMKSTTAIRVTHTENFHSENFSMVSN